MSIQKISDDQWDKWVTDLEHYHKIERLYLACQSVMNDTDLKKAETYLCELKARMKADGNIFISSLT